MIRATALVGLFLSLSACRGAAGLDRKTGPEYEEETTSWMAVLERHGGNGMWLVTRGYHTGDDLVAMASNASVSHAVVLDLDRRQVIEAVGKGIVATDLRSFLQNSHLMHLMRPHDWSPESGAAAVERARGKIGAGYDFFGIVGVPAEGRFYCSELAAWSSGIRVNRPGPAYVLHPKDLTRYADILFSSGERDGVADVVKPGM